MPRHKPYTIKVELVRGCTQRCPFCALPNMPWADDPWEFMCEKTFVGIVDDLANWCPKLRMEFAERGEQMFHPKLRHFIECAREALPEVYMLMTSNGDKAYKMRGDFVEYCEELLDLGLNVLMLDCYTEERYTAFKEMFPSAKLFYEDSWHPYRYMNPKRTRTILLVDGTPGKSNVVRKFHNTAGSTDPVLAAKFGYDVRTIIEPLRSMCVRPFREIEVHYDGTVPLCCIDWKEEVVIGNVNDTSLDKLWGAMDPYRRHLLAKDRAAIQICSKCSERTGFRSGLEYNWFGDSS